MPETPMLARCRHGTCSRLDEAVIEVPGGQFTVIAHNNSDTNRYIKSVKLNGKPYDKMYIDYADIMNGGTLEFEMGN